MAYDYKQDFPLLRALDVAYIDNAATAQRPQCVLDAENDFYCRHNANPLRGLYPLSVEATDAYEAAREAVRDFLGAASTQEIIFTRNTTESLNLVAYSYGLTFLKPGDEILVQISRDAMKGKLPAVTTNLNFTGKYLVLTTGDKKFGLSSKLSNDERSRLSKWMEEEVSRPDKEFGIIVRTNAADASREEILKELEYLKGVYRKAAVDGRSRTCFSCVYKTEPFYISAVRDANSRNLEEIVTDSPEISRQISDYLDTNSPEEKEKLRFYEDKLLPLYKLHRLETALEEIQHEKVWLNSGGFLVIQQTEAFVSIDVNSGKFTGKKKMQVRPFWEINMHSAIRN